MSSSTTAPAQLEQIRISRLWWVGPLAVVATVAANLIVRLAALALFDIRPNFPPLSNAGPTVAFTIIGTSGAVIVFAIISRFARRPVRLFRIIAAIVLLISFLPDVRMLPFESAAAVGTLMLMHVVAAAVSVGMLTTLAREK
jgi:hypothetical protein